MKTVVFILVVVFLLLAVAYLFYLRSQRHPARHILRTGEPLPSFQAVAEDGTALSSASLQGRPAVILFVRGSWCPFCTRQVEKLTRHYKEIVSLGARLILLTPKPLDTTRRVAEFFGVEFEFWLDENLQIARQLGLLLDKGVPKSHRSQFGRDTVWPAAVISDDNGTVRFVQISRTIADRPNPTRLLDELRKLKNEPQPPRTRTS